MTRHDNPTYYEHVCEVIRAVMSAENECIKRGLLTKAKAREITADEYVEAVADELLSTTDASEIEL